MAFAVQHMLAGAVAGIAEHLAMFPVDTIKTRMQALAHPGQRVSYCFFFFTLTQHHQQSCGGAGVIQWDPSSLLCLCCASVWRF